MDSRIRTTVAVRLPPVDRPHDELVLPSPGCPRLQRYRRLVPDSGGIDHESSITLHLQLILVVQWSSCAVLRHTRRVASPWVCDMPSACRQTANSQSTPEQNLLPKGIVNRSIFDSENFRVNRLSSIKVTSRFSPHLFYRSQTKVKIRKQDCRSNPRMKLGMRELQQCYPTPRKLPNLNPLHDYLT